jgi:hypothetical protein
MLSALFRLNVQPYLISWFKYDILTKMNHIFRELNLEERTENIATYNRPELPLALRLVEKIVAPKSELNKNL